MENEGTDNVKIKEEVNDQDEMEADSFTVKEEMVFVDMNVKEELEDPDADSLKTTLSGRNTTVPGAAAEVPIKKEMAGSNNINPTKRTTIRNSSFKKDKISPGTLSEGRPTRTIKAPKQYSPTAYKPGPASRRKRKSHGDDSECEPSTTSSKKQTSTESGSSDKSDYFEKATSSKQVHEVDNDDESDNGDDQDDIDDDDEDEIDDDEEAEENSSYPSLDDSAEYRPQKTLLTKRSRKRKAPIKNECSALPSISESPKNNFQPTNNASETTDQGERYRPRTRTIPPYKDTNSTHSDDRIFCHDCCREWESDCPRHGPLVIVEDTPIPADINDALRAIKTAPPQLTVSKSSIPKAGCGVHATQAIPGRVRFGPYQGKIVPPVLATSYAWLVRKNGKPDHCVDATEPGCSNWMRYVNCCRTDEERNLEAFQYKGKLYYKTLRPIAEGEELLVSYGEAYERHLCELEKNQAWEGLESSAENYSLPSGLLGSLGDVSWSCLPSGDFEIWDACAAQVTSTSNSSDETGARKQGANSSNWRRTLSKEALDRGLEHINARGQPIRARKLGPNCGTACRFKCPSRISEEARLIIFNTFWGIGNHTGQWEFIAKHCELYQPKQRKKDAIRPISASRKYFFRIGNDVIYVCKRMFCNTLDISEKWVHTALKRKLDDETVAPDRRGKHPKIGKVLKSVKDSVRTHIRMIPPVYTRVGRSVRHYVEEGLTVRAMYRLYAEWMDQNAQSAGGKPPRKASERQYRDIFLAELNVGFFKRAKDECSFCERYDEGDAEVKKQMQARYDEHFGNKEAMKELRAKDRLEYAPVKEPAVAASSTTCYACFDLLKVFVTPKTENNELHYRKRLSVYNFNVYDSANHECFCFLWDEGIARAGESEIVSCLLYFVQIQYEENGMVDFRFYSGSSDLNKNKYLFSMYCYVAARYGVKVTHRFFEWGHTQNESDGVIGVIERASKGQDIFVPSQWYDIVKESKKTGKPYRVIQPNQDMIFNFGRLARNLQWRKDSSGEKISWNQVKEVVVTNEQVTLRYNLAEEDYVVVPAQAGCPVEVCSWKLEKLYDEPLPIPTEKYNDLVALCKSSVIPVEYHEFYESFRSSTDVEEPPRRYYNDADPSEDGVLSDNFDDSDNE